MIASFAFSLVLSSMVPTQGGQTSSPIPARTLIEAKEIIALSKSENLVMEHLFQLCTKIGARPTGSPEFEKATKWAEAKFKSFGLSNVVREQWGEVPVGFSRGKRSGRFLGEGNRAIPFATNFWTAGTKGTQRGSVVLAPKNLDDLESVKSKLKNAWILCDTPTSMGGANTAREDKALRAAIDEVGILGRIYSSKNDLLHTHGSWKGKSLENLPTSVDIVVRKQDFDELVTSASGASGVRPKLVEFNIESKWSKGPIAVHNVIAEIKGTEFPDEVVVIGGHIDSWDTLGSQGACDNGTGTSAVLEAARLVQKSGLKPRRTIRFMLFGGEEQGLLGSGAYVEKHVLEMPNVSACIVDDGGTNYESGISGIASWKPFFEPTFELMTQAFPDMPMGFQTVEKYNGSGGSDQGSFWAKGVPAFFMGKAGRANYTKIWHTQNDRYEEAIPEYLRQCATSLAVLSYTLACANSKLPRI